jgi:ABC-type transporter Mla subunit MlaD
VSRKGPAVSSIDRHAPDGMEAYTRQLRAILEGHSATMDDLNSQIAALKSTTDQLNAQIASLKAARK